MDREKAIKGLNNISREIINTLGHGEAIPYLRMIDNVIALLKEQEDLGTELTNAIELIHKKNERIEKLLKEQEWHILTEDADGIVHGLPGDDGQYLMTDGKDIWIDDYVDGVDDGVWLDSGRNIREIKAWMYMPELPKKDRR